MHPFTHQFVLQKGLRNPNNLKQHCGTSWVCLQNKSTGLSSGHSPPPPAPYQLDSTAHSMEEKQAAHGGGDLIPWAIGSISALHVEKFLNPWRCIQCVRKGYGLSVHVFLEMWSNTSLCIYWLSRELFSS